MEEFDARNFVVAYDSCHSEDRKFIPLAIRSISSHVD